MNRNKNLILILFFLLLSVQGWAAAPIYRIQIEDYIIHPITAEYIEKSIERAEQEKAQALLIVLDTPGGLLQTTRLIVKKIMNAEIPVIVYVSPAGSRAASAGVFITLSAHVAAMAPLTHIGAAHPVELGEGQKNPLEELTKKKEDGPETREEGPRTRDHGPETKKEKEPPTSPMIDKIMQDTLAWVENIAKSRGRNVEWAKKSVEESASITAEKALQLGVIDFIAKDEPELLAKLDGKTIKLPTGSVTLQTKGAAVQTIELSWRQSLLNILINPNIAYILLTLGFYGLLFEITHPGSWAPGVAGLICLLLAFYSFHIIPTSYAGIILTVLGLMLLGAELYVISHGALALGGLVCLFFGAVFLVDQPADFLKISLKIIVPTLLASAAIFGLLFTLVVRSARRKVVSGEEAMAGALGEADTDIDSASGKVFVQGELWDAYSEAPIRKGDKVEILKLDNFRLYVKKA